jgi:hypothetical protein
MKSVNTVFLALALSVGFQAKAVEVTKRLPLDATKIKVSAVRLSKVGTGEFKSIETGPDTVMIGEVQIPNAVIAIKYVSLSGRCENDTHLPHHVCVNYSNVRLSPKLAQQIDSGNFEIKGLVSNVSIKKVNFAGNSQVASQVPVATFNVRTR